MANPLVSQTNYEGTVIEPQVVASTRSPLTELSLNESVVPLTLVGLTYDQHAFYRWEVVTVSGIDDVRIKPTNSARVSDTVAKVTLGGKVLILRYES